MRDELKGLIFSVEIALACRWQSIFHDWFQNAEVNTTTCAETAHITAISNDLSYEDVFSYLIHRILSDKDILVTISTSGDSPNIVKALEAGREKGAYGITFSRKASDNTSRKLGDLNFYLLPGTYGLVESVYGVILHTALNNFLEKYIGEKHR